MLFGHNRPDKLFYWPFSSHILKLLKHFPLRNHVRGIDSETEEGEGAEGEAGQGRGSAHHPLHQAFRSKI